MAGLLIVIQGHAQDVPPPSPEQVAQYREGFNSECLEDSARSGENVEKVKAYCSCMASRIGEYVSPQEWQAGATLALAGKRGEEMKLMGPRIRQAAKACLPTLK
jgi:hypothetical protein